MKTALLLIMAMALVALVPEPGAAARPEVGVKCGLNITGFHGQDAPTTYPRGLYCIGGYADVPLGGVVSLQGEVLYTVKGGRLAPEKIGGGYSDVEFQLGYVEVPLLIKVGATEGGGTKPYLLAGAAVSKNIGATLTTDGAEADINDVVRSIDMGVVLGSGVSFHLGPGRAAAEVRFAYGLASIYDSDQDADVLNEAVSFVLGWGF
jgi:hypothetical protein